MGDLRQTLSKLTHLITFEAASRADNFSRAADDLGVTRVSVSRQIAELEEFLGAKLFHRHHRNTSLTQAGRMLATTTNPALQEIAAIVRQIRIGASDKRLSVTTTTAFATYWLMPRVVGFNAQHPEVELNLVVSDRYLDLDTEGIDVAIRYTENTPRDGDVTPLFRETVYPVYSPRYKPRTALKVPADLLKENLLGLSGRYKPGARWPNWFQHNGLSMPSENLGVTINTYINMLQAAIEGQGIALAGFPLVDPYLEDGTLKTVPGTPSVERDYFYLIDKTEGRPDAEKFCNWVRGQAEQCQNKRDALIATP